MLAHYHWNLVIHLCYRYWQTYFTRMSFRTCCWRGHLPGCFNAPHFLLTRVPSSTPFPNSLAYIQMAACLLICVLPAAFNKFCSNKLEPVEFFRHICFLSAWKNLTFYQYRQGPPFLHGGSFQLERCTTQGVVSVGRYQTEPRWFSSCVKSYVGTLSLEPSDTSMLPLLTNIFHTNVLSNMLLEGSSARVLQLLNLYWHGCRLQLLFQTVLPTYKWQLVFLSVSCRLLSRNSVQTSKDMSLKPVEFFRHICLVWWLPPFWLSLNNAVCWLATLTASSAIMSHALEQK